MAFYVPGISWGGRTQNGRKNINAQSGSQDTSTPYAPARLHRRLMIVAAIDIGGTFTHLMAVQERRRRFVQAQSPPPPAAWAGTPRPRGMRGAAGPGGDT